jgi:hypothetical protein
MGGRRRRAGRRVVRPGLPGLGQSADPRLCGHRARGGRLQSG